MNKELGQHPAFANNNFNGMSKRFYAACAAMQGLLSNESMIDNHNLDSIEWIAKHAIMQADELLKQE